MAHPNRFHLAGVMGDPVMHTRSPKMHGYWLQKYGLAGAYVPLHIKAEGLGAALRALHALGFAGCNLTIPHKETALSLVDTLDTSARHMGAMNCVVVQPDGSLKGYNYDAFGYVESVLEAHPDANFNDGPIIVLGAGGAARAVAAGLAGRGAKDIRITNRSPDRAAQIAKDLGAPVTTFVWADRNAALADAAMLVNTTSAGMVGQPDLDMDLSRLSTRALVSDVIYVPQETKLLAAARARGNRVVNGMGMLLHQGRPAFQQWFGIMPDVTPELRALMMPS
jgi:shikimate dehydrogenase